MTANAVLTRTPLTRDEAGTLFSRTMTLVAMTTAIFACGAYLAREISPGWSWILFIGAFVLLIAISAASRRSEQLAVGFLFGFGFLIGAAVAPTVTYYTRANPQALWEAGGATALFVAGFGSLGYAVRRDLSTIARALSWGLLALILVGVVAILVHIPHSSAIFAVVGLVVFAGLTSYDFQRLRRAKDIRTAPLLAASIFLDILNIFLLFLTFGRTVEK